MSYENTQLLIGLNGLVHYTEKQDLKNDDKFVKKESINRVPMTGYQKPAEASAITPADNVMQAIGKLEASSALNAVAIDSRSTVAFSLGCDSNGVYFVTPDEEEG